MKEWKKVKLKDITISITDGKHGDCKGQDNSGYYFISCKDVSDGTIHYENARQITKEDFIETDKRTNLATNDILITNSGTIGRMAFVKDIPETRKTTFQKSVAIVKPNTDKVLPIYLYYLLQSKVSEFVNSSNGAAQKNLLLSTMREFELSIEESFSIQQRIATILSRYDSLIENYQKQIKLLEESAQRLYMEWFIDLRFPGHENTKIVNGVPDGWEKKKITDLITLLNGYAFKSASFDDSGKYKIVTIKNVKDGTFDGGNVSCIKSIPERMPLHCKLEQGDILLSLTGNVGRVCMVIGGNFLLNQRVAKLKSKYPAFTYCLFRNNDMFISINNLANGAAQQNVSPIRIGELPLMIANIEILESFEIIAWRMVSQILSLSSQIHNLTEARDRLLPKLMSGEVIVNR